MYTGGISPNHLFKVPVPKIAVSALGQVEVVVIVATAAVASAFRHLYRDISHVQEDKEADYLHRETAPHGLASYLSSRSWGRVSIEVEVTVVVISGVVSSTPQVRSSLPLACTEGKADIAGTLNVAFYSNLRKRNAKCRPTLERKLNYTRVRMEREETSG